jgi:hypothetical protein
MTGSRALFRYQFLAIVSCLAVSCGGDAGGIAEPPEVDAASRAGTTGGAREAGGDRDAGATFFVDRPVDLAPDMPLPPDASPPRDGDQPADVASPPSDPGVIVPTSCYQIPCQDLFLAAANCNGDGQMCQSQVVTQGEVVRSNYCLANGVKKQSTSTSSDEGYETIMRVSRPDGSHCYTLELRGSDKVDVETMVWRSPGGFVLLSGTWSKSTDRLILSCGPSKYEPRDLGCPGLEGEPGSDCPAGMCPE